MESENLKHLNISNIYNVRGKSALVTGGGSGIGQMITRILLANGASVVYIVSRKMATLEKTASELNSLFGTSSKESKCIAIESDLADEKGCIKVREELESKYNQKHLDILINNSGANWAQSIEQYSESGFDKVMSINVKAAFFLTKHLLPLLTKYATAQRPSSIINVGSIHGERVPFVDTFAYSASKAAIHHLTRHLASKLAQRHVLVNALACGMFHTKMTDVTLKNFEKHILDNIPLERIGNEIDLAQILIPLCSASWITGTVIPVDGGVIIKGNL